MKRLIIGLTLIFIYTRTYSQDSIRLVRACGIDTFFTSMLVAQSWPMSEENVRLCKKLLYTNGQQRATIYLKNSNDAFVRFAVAGMTSDGIVSILINESSFEGYGFTEKMKFAFIAHELGHINHFHYIKKAPLDSLDELNADFYSGFCSAREGYSADSSVYPFSLLSRSSSDIHPPFERRRISILEGFIQSQSSVVDPRIIGNEPFAGQINYKVIDLVKKINAKSEQFEDTTYSDLLHNYLSAACIIVPLRTSPLNKGETEWFDVSLSIQSTLPSMPNDTLMKFIKKVEYGLDTSFPGAKRQRFKESFDRGSNFKFSIPPTWGDFDVPIIVTFQDESIASFVYKLRLKPKSDDQKRDAYGILSHFK